MNAKTHIRTLTMAASVIAVVLSACAAPAAPAQRSRTSANNGPVSAPPAAAAPTENDSSANTSNASSNAPSNEAPRPINPGGVVAADSSQQNGGPRPITNDPNSRIASEPTSVSQPQEPPKDETYRDYGVNPWVNTQQDHFSTFALDVDTASYSVMRRFVNEGNLPPYASVRAEEYINYFQQDYPVPSQEATFGVYVDGALSPFQNDGTYILRVGVQGYTVPESQRKPANLVLVIDESGSMAEGGRLEVVKDSLTYLVNKLRPDDTVGIVTFSDDARVVLSPTPVRNRDRILDVIYALQPTNGTNTQSGLYLAYEMLSGNFRPEAVNRVVLATDGVANQGITDPEAILSSMGRYMREDIYLTAVGFGRGNFNDDFLQRLANKGDGTYAYVDTLDEARKIFSDNIVAALQPIAKDAKIQVDFNPDVVAAYRLIGYEDRAVADQDFRNDAVDAGELNAGHNATAIYAVKLRTNAEGRRKIGSVYLRWQDVNTKQVKELNGEVFTSDLAGSFQTASPRYQLNVVVAEFAEILRQSPYTTTPLRTLSQFAANVARQLPSDPDVQEFANLVQIASARR